MIKTRLYTCLTLCFFSLLVFADVSAQIRVAAMGGIHSSELIQSNSLPAYETAEGQYFSTKTGFELGFLAEIPLGNKKFFLQPAILYSAKGNQYEKFYDSAVYHSDTLYNQHTLNLNYVQIPFYLTWKAPLSKTKKNQFYLSVGPYFAFIFSASQPYQNRIKQFNTDKYVYQTGTEDLPVGNDPGQYKTFDIGIAARAGFELGNMLIGAYFSRGLTNVYTAYYPSSFHNQVFGGSLGIWLNKVKPEELPPNDEDHDGTPDADDSCRTISGPPGWHGCPIPDSDHDGVNDEIDSCKTTPGSLKYHGCPIPDGDLDGVNDEIDSCIHTPGSIQYNGCPVPDRDGDEINDEVDKCPDQPGILENQGCPIVKSSIIQRAALVAANVMFNSNSTKLTNASYPAIRELADSLKTNPDLNLLVEGYTDNIGNPAYNRKLSDDRAESVKSALIKEGVNPIRISVKGFGDSQPIANNDTAAGRARNRRVVFVFELRSVKNCAWITIYIKHMMIFAGPNKKIIDYNGAAPERLLVI